MTKKRIYDLAKEYGMSGQDLAKKLRDLGFSQVKSHMTALDDFEVLQIQGVLEAHGLIQPAHEDEEGDDTLGGLVLRKRKKRKTAATSQPAATSRAAEEEEAAEEAPPPERKAPPIEEQELLEGKTPVGHTPVGHEEVGHEPQPTPPEVEEPAESEAPRVHAAELEEAEAVAPRALAPEPKEPSGAPAEPEPELRAEESSGEEVEPDAGPALGVQAAAPPAAPAGAAPLAAASAESAPAEAPAPGAESGAPGGTPRRLGKVVGFIDLSKLQTTQPRRMESRRLSSRDDVAPDVRPTLGHDRSRALLRGDRGVRGTLSAAELREREAGRYLRRKTVTPGPRGGGPARGGPPQRGRDEASSPHAGSKVRIAEPVTVKKLADHLSVKPGELLKTAFTSGGLPFGSLNINSLLDHDTAALLAGEYQVELDIVREIEAEEALITDIKSKRSGVDDELLASRPPAVAFLGHVDHGKTTLIDTIRDSRVAEGEAGGITQHIGAYQVSTKKGHVLTILDTPGHQAFTAMRARGAKAVDIVVLVVAADDGVMPSTEEAIAHARAAGAPIVVALTKMDKAEANPQKVVNQLAALGLLSEALGGETAVLEVSALKKQGVEELLERVFLESEVLELRCHRTGPASGVVLEAEVHEGKGIVAHLLVQDGTLKPGDVILAGEGYGKVRSMHDDRGGELAEAGPSKPVEVSGLSALPGIGEPFYVVESLGQAKEVAEERERKNRARSLTERRTLDARSLLAVTGSKRETINVIVRADVQGSVEALRHQISELKHEEVEVRVLHAGVGAVTESDVMLGQTSNALLIAFHVGVNDKAREAAERAGVQIRYYKVIYELLDELREMMEGTLAPEISEQVTGHVEVRVLFKSSKFGTIAGSYVLDGTVARDSKVRLLRDGRVVYTGAIGSLRREKDDAREVREGYECGIVLKDFDDLREGDVIETYKTVQVKRTLGDGARV